MCTAGALPTGAGQPSGPRMALPSPSFLERGNRRAECWHEKEGLSPVNGTRHQVSRGIGPPAGQGPPPPGTAPRQRRAEGAEAEVGASKERCEA